MMERAARIVMKIGSGLLLLTAAIVTVATTAHQSIDLPSYHLDGAFQTASSLFRLSAGQWPGRDFVAYLGLGPVYALYPFFLLHGGDLAASVFSAQCTVYLSMFLAIAFIARFSGVSLLASLAISAASMLAMLYYRAELPYLLLERVSPGNSLRPVRAAIPYLACIAAWHAMRAPVPHLRFALLGAIAGVSALWSNDYGLATFCGVALFAGMQAWPQKRKASPGAWFAIGVLLGGGLLLAIATAFHPMPWLAYHFSDVARSQWWYFGDWEEASRIFTLAGLIKLFNWPFAAALLVLAALAAAASPTSRRDWQLLTVCGVALCLGGLVPQFGTVVTPTYLYAFFFWACAVAAIFLLRALHRHLPAWMPAALCLLGSIYAVHFTHARITELAELKQSLPGDAARLYVPELGGYLAPNWAPYLDAVRSGDAPLEEYWGVASALRRTVPDVPVDSVIHALGRQQAPFFAALAAGPARVTTTNPALSPDWQSWSLSANWWFYRPLLLGYERTGESPTTWLWERRAGPLEPMPAPCRIEGGRLTLDGRDGLYDVTLSYRVERGFARALVMVRNHINLGLGANGFLSLDPSAGEARFPALLTGGRRTLEAMLRPAHAGNLALLSCSAARMPNTSAAGALHYIP